VQVSRSTPLFGVSILTFTQLAQKATCPLSRPVLRLLVRLPLQARICTDRPPVRLRRRGQRFFLSNQLFGDSLADVGNSPFLFFIASKREAVSRLRILSSTLPRFRARSMDEGASSPSCTNRDRTHAVPFLFTLHRLGNRLVVFPLPLSTGRPFSASNTRSGDKPIP